ncbi:MAG: undecaprenyl-diphosphate phosphatase [Oligoflexales bacterium]
MYPFLLGLVQGIAEFLPISSSAHLIITSWWMEGEALSLPLNVSLHMGTLFAVLFYFRQDWFDLFTGACKDLYQRKKIQDSLHLKKWTILILASLPAGIIGLTAKDAIEHHFHNPLSTALPLFIVGLLLWWFDHKSSQTKNIDQISIKEGVLIGCAQACALIPGVSRSGATILTARILKINRTDAARFSFLLGTPAMGGAALLHAPDILSSLHNPIFQIGITTSCLVGCFTIHFLLKWIKQAGFGIFAIYRCLLASVILYLYFPSF